MNIQAVIFDMDGLLVDSEPIQFEASRMLFRRYGHTFTKQNLKEFLGVRLIEELTILKDRWELKPTIGFLTAERKEIYLHLIRHSMVLAKGAKKLLTFLRDRDFPIGLGTSAQQWYIDEIFNKFHLHMYFDAVVGSDQVTQGKPHPEVYQKVAAKLHIHPSACLVLEDAVSGVLAARMAGMLCFAVPNPYTAKEEFNIADRTFPSLDEVTVYLQNTLGKSQRNLAKSVTVK